MKKNQITVKESLYLIYAYVSISTFLLLVISKITENLEKALDFHPIVSVLIALNMVVFVSLSLYIRKHDTQHNHF